MRKLLLVALGVLMLAAFRVEPVQAQTVAVVTADLNVRAGPSTRYHALTVIPAGAPVDVLGCSAGWCEIAFDGIVGYVSERYLSYGGYAYTPPPVYVPAPTYRSYPYSYGHRSYSHRSYRPHRSYRSRVSKPRRVEKRRITKPRRVERPRVSKPRRAEQKHQMRRSVPRVRKDSARRGSSARNRGRVHHNERSRSKRRSGEHHQRSKRRHNSSLIGPMMPGAAPATYAVYVDDVRIMTV